MTENELFRVKGERKGFALLEYYRIIVTDQRVVIARTSKGHTKFTALAPKYSKFDKMAPAEVLNLDKNSFAVNHGDATLKGRLIGGAIVVPNKEGKRIEIGLLPGDFKKLKGFLHEK